MRGFTLIELVVVITVLSLLAAFALSAYTELDRNAKRSRAISDIQTLGKQAATEFHEFINRSIELPLIAGGRKAEAILSDRILYHGNGNAADVYWGDLFSRRKVPVCPIDGRPYLIRILEPGARDFSYHNISDRRTEITVPEFMIFWKDAETETDSIFAVFRP